MDTKTDLKSCKDPQLYWPILCKLFMYFICFTTAEPNELKIAAIAMHQDTDSTSLGP